MMLNYQKAKLKCFFSKPLATTKIPGSDMKLNFNAFYLNAVIVAAYCHVKTSKTRYKYSVMIQLQQHCNKHKNNWVHDQLGAKKLVYRTVKNVAEMFTCLFDKSLIAVVSRN